MNFVNKKKKNYLIHLTVLPGKDSMHNNIGNFIFHDDMTAIMSLAL
jgi:hypothetical protein